jgi:hypothetical protein
MSPNGVFTVLATDQPDPVALPLKGEQSGNARTAIANELNETLENLHSAAETSGTPPAAGLAHDV